MARAPLGFAWVIRREEAGGKHYRPELGVGEEADMDFLQSTVGLVWRTLVLWLLLLLMLEIAGWAG